MMIIVFLTGLLIHSPLKTSELSISLTIFLAGSDSNHSASQAFLYIIHLSGFQKKKAKTSDSEILAFYYVPERIRTAGLPLRSKRHHMYSCSSIIYFVHLFQIIHESIILLLLFFISFACSISSVILSYQQAISKHSH